MKRLGLILLVWTVYVSTGEYENGTVTVTHYYAKHDIGDDQPSAVQCGETMESCRDFVWAMNAAHEDRQQNEGPVHQKKKKAHAL